MFFTCISASSCCVSQEEIVHHCCYRGDILYCFHSGNAFLLLDFFLRQAVDKQWVEKQMS